MDEDFKKSDVDDGVCKNKLNNAFIPEINEKSRKIAEELRIKSILDLYDTISDGKDVIDLMSFECSSVKTQITLTHHQKLSIQYFIPFAIRKATKMEIEDIPDNSDKLMDLIKINYNSAPVLVEFNGKMCLYFTRNGFLETMLIYLRLPNGKKYPLPIKFNYHRKTTGSDNVNIKRSNTIANNKGRDGIVSKSSLKKENRQNYTIGPQMNRAINNYLKKKEELRNGYENESGKGESNIKLDPECTFKPKIIKTLYEKYKNKLKTHPQTKNNECMNMIKKFLLLDNNDKDEKVESYFKSVQECTFQPNIDKYINNMATIKENKVQKNEDKQKGENNDQTNNDSSNGLMENEIELIKEQTLVDFEKRREELVEKLIQEEWDKNVLVLFEGEYNLKYSTLMPLEDILNTDSDLENNNKTENDKEGKIINYEWETREQGPIYNRSLRQRLRQKFGGDTNIKESKARTEYKKETKRYTPPYKWHEDLRSENDKYVLEQEKINGNSRKNNECETEIKQFDGIRWERYIRLKDRHLKSIPVANYRVVSNLDKGVEARDFSNIVKSLNGIYDIGTPITVVGVRENIIKYLEKELSKPLPDLLELYTK
ncbi:hypothetical protein FG386_001188 [Cryptosporidium ryanae]|uniref:uncharacterized protein n=1 Tax=Cryptosporidium ryanae TaxID=515981 RepID=UPI00351A143E|nr:hypothetical protein FG386_001188 [Cryptosporidium ryanae]